MNHTISFCNDRHTGNTRYCLLTKTGNNNGGNKYRVNYQGKPAIHQYYTID